MLRRQYTREDLKDFVSISRKSPELINEYLAAANGWHPISAAHQLAVEVYCLQELLREWLATMPVYWARLATQGYWYCRECGQTCEGTPDKIVHTDECKVGKTLAVLGE